MKQLVPCMGGWCRSREKCAHYYTQSPNMPAERLCGPQEEPESLLAPQTSTEPSEALVGPL